MGLSLGAYLAYFDSQWEESMDSENKAWVIIICVLAFVIGATLTTCIIVDRHADVKAAELGICWVPNAGGSGLHMERCK